METFLCIFITFIVVVVFWCFYAYYYMKHIALVILFMEYSAT